MKASAVVLDVDEDLRPLLPRADEQPAGGRLALALTLLRRLDAVIDGVSHQMNERLAELFKDLLVESGGRAFETEFRLLAKVAAEIAHHAEKRLENRRQRQQAQVADAFVNVVDQ